MSDSTDKLIDLAGAVIVVGMADRIINNDRSSRKKKNKGIFDF